MKKTIICVLLITTSLVVANCAFASDKSEQYKFLEETYRLFGENGEYYEWSFDAKTQWLHVFQPTASDDERQFIDLLLESNDTENRIEEQIDTFWANKYGYGRATAISVYYALEEAWGDDFYWTLEQFAQMSEWIMKYMPNKMVDIMLYCVPDATVITRQQAIDVAWSAIADAYGFADDYHSLGIEAGYVNYGISRMYAADYPPHYVVSFRNAETQSNADLDGAPSIVFVSQDGIAMDDSYLPYVQNIEDLGSPFDPIPTYVPFSGWTLEEKATFTNDWRSFMQSYMQSHPEYRGLYYYETINAYGLPDRNALSQDEAESIAHQAAIDFGASTQYLKRSESHFFYDVTNPDNPLWKVYMSTLFSNELSYRDPLGYFATIDAHSG